MPGLVVPARFGVAGLDLSKVAEPGPTRLASDLAAGYSAAKSTIGHSEDAFAGPPGLRG